ncbi:MAG: transposase, partial [Microcystis sp. M165S2]|nr:transposase [Microcystis sp. M165S2]
QLAYKCRWYGRNYIEIDRWFPSSKRCSNCGYIAEKMPLNIREWDCPDWLFWFLCENEVYTDRISSK